MFTKVFIMLTVVVAIRATGVTLVNTGVSSTSRHQDSNGNYGFNYDIVDAQGASNSRSERGDAYGNKQGSYSLRDTDGRARTVDYIADGQGFRAVVKTNEPGTAFSAPAGVVIDSPYEEPKAPKPVAVAPVLPPTPVVAPVAPAPAPVVAPAVPAPVIPAPVAVSPVARPPPVAHPAPVAVAPSVHPVAISPPSFGSHSSRVDIVHTVPVHVAPFAHVIPVASPFFAGPVISRFGHGHNIMGIRGFIYGRQH